MNIKNKVKTLLVGASVVSCMSITAFAADHTNPNGDTTVTANAFLSTDPVYTVTIPDTVDFGNITKSSTSNVVTQPIEVMAEGDKSLSGKQIDVTISVADGNFVLKNAATNMIPYAVYNVENGGEALANQGIFASFTKTGSVTGRVQLDTKDIPVAGSYTGIINFTIALNNSSSAEGWGAPDVH